MLQELAGGGGLRLNVGCGPGTVEGWVNVDICRSPGVLLMDATRQWPIPDGCAEAVNSEHFIEHLTLDEARFYFTEAFRALRPGGVIRTSTPDLAGMTAAYAEADPALLEAHRSHGYAARNHGDMVNNYFYMHGHRHIYDFASLAAMLADAGFGGIERASFGESPHALLRGIDTHEPGELRSLVVAVDAVKPG
jgi:predicted SAM-dependent methyltransferase